MRRKPGSLTTGETDVLLAAAQLARANEVFYGYALARQLEESASPPRTVGYATLYDRLKYLETVGLLQGRWERQETALARGRPARRLYRLTAAGLREAARLAAERHRQTRVARRREGLSEA